MAQLPKGHPSYSVVHEFCQSDVLEHWKLCCDRGELLDGLKRHFRVWVPLVFGNSHDSAKEEHLAEKYLFRPMTEFMCGGNPEEVFSQLKNVDTPSQICGHVFKPGEPTYSCRDCANDPTCVFCIDCFQNSSHKQHRYRMNTSGGNGYCDCGDTEAWKVEPFCSLHSSSMEQNDQVNPVDLLPVDLANRASALFLASLQYAIDLLMWKQCVQLPGGLDPEETVPDIHHCMLFNDEVHSYDQVITTLQRAVDCSQREAIDYATIVDREGRSIVKSGTEQECEKAKEIIEGADFDIFDLILRNTSRHNSKPLKVLVMHNVVVAHQSFALKLIQWLQNIISKSDGLRRLFCLLSMNAPPKKDLCDAMEIDDVDAPASLMERVLLADTQLWKVVRVKIHQLLMAGALMDQECKKLFAGMFTKCYEQLMKEFCLDDHDHDVSVMSLSVQMFTVPSLARWLITEYNLLHVILQSFLTACKQKKDKDGRLCFDRNDRSPSFKRASYMLYDIKYALLARPVDPEDWSDALRTNFLNGVVSLLELLRVMQGMDGVTRQTGQHLEFEPEWEGAFNLQLKLEDTLVLFTRWCSMDKVVLIEAYKETLEALYHSYETSKKEKGKCEVAGHTTKSMKYDVSNQPISIHLPLTRFLAALHLHLEKFDLTFHSPELMTKKRLDPVDLLEPPLRAQVMIAQTQAGMWRRNGFALLNQIFFYHNVRCRGEMYDRDILMLQIVASLLNPNDFIVHLLNKFNLLHWAKPEYDIPGGQEDSVRQTVMLAEEFLNLLIILLEERYIPGVGSVTQQDVIKREIVHQLCIMPMAHSELAKGLPVDPNSETGMEDVVNEVAEFKKPSSTGKGKYDLKPEYYKMYCPYFYHYTKAEQSKSEEAQRKRKKQAGESQALPPPVPPPLTSQFAAIVNILHCDVMFHIFKMVLTRTAAQRSRSWSEAQFERILYIIGIALHEQKRAFKEGNTSYDFLTKAMKEDGLLSKLQCLVGNQNLNQDPSRDLLAWSLKQFAEVCTLKSEPVCLETLHSLASCTDQKTETERKRKAEMAAKRRARVMAQISKMQRNFIAENSELFDQTSTELKTVTSDMDLGVMVPPTFPVALGPHRSQANVTGPIQATCILCQEEQEISCSGKAMVLAAFVQRSTVLSQSRGKMLDKKDDYDPLFVPVDLFTGTHVSSCGHVMHHDCWQRYFDNVMNKERRRPLRFRQSFSYDIDKMEYLCPLCEGLSNTVIPIVPSLPSLYPAGNKKEVDLRFDDWLDGIEKTVQNSIKEAQDKESEDDFSLFQPCPISTITRMMAESVAKNFQLLWEYVYDDASGHFSEGMREMLKKFARDVYAFGLSVEPDDESPRVSILAWSTCAFTIQSVEQNLRGEGKSLFGSIPTRQADLIGSLVRFAAVCSQVMNPDMVKQNCVRLLSALIPCDSEKVNKGSPCLLDLDMFHFLTIVTMTLPSLYVDQQHCIVNTLPTGDLNNQHAMQLVVTAHIVQILLTFAWDTEESMDVESDSEGEALLKIYLQLQKTAGLTPEKVPSPYQLLQYVRSAVMPFLRCAAILYFHITGVSPPDELHDHFCTKEYEVLCRYLSLPVNMSELFESVGDITTALIKSWCSSKSLRDRLSANSEKIVRYPIVKNDLVPLPVDYSELINKVSTFTCPKSKDSDDSRAPTMCLVCGQMLCSQSYCCQKDLEGSSVGAATEHAYFCGAGTGVFLRVRDCQILLLAGKTKGCFLAPPYLDNYGETDQGLRRGNPLHLCEERYSHLKKLWFTHAIPETIAHNLEFNSSFTTIEWQNL
ncbi:E3 ubiquitin-protein ligase UBR2-like isoform X2 [Gigantopelta aegis]|uniref:E3 ubiquitin-protein ligase UBR2-like isoform X2 n=1 Tax=Gigantopelta aegis TaxID=1735272 RepID=UPI001B88C269|nr:E3 ubiquitin-protein ligase UBR2-like isoform X2 [Gigantopelta aegis]